MPPSVTAGAIASVSHLKTNAGVELRKQHQERSTKLKLMLLDAGLPVVWSESHIVPLMIGDPTLCKQASDLLLSDYGIYVQPINYPTVPRGTERLRFTPSPLHDDRLMGVSFFFNNEQAALNVVFFFFFFVSERK